MVETSNYAKFQTANPLVRLLIDRFFSRLGRIVAPLRPETVLDAGCGEGEAIERLGGVLPRRVAAVDIQEQCLAFTRRRLPFVETSLQSVYELDFEDGAFDLVLCLEVLEHLERPDEALEELCRVCRGGLVLSVPHEPYFRLGNLTRGKHARRLGNHPEHVNHWGRRGFRAFLERHLEAAELTPAFPWLIARCPAALASLRASRRRRRRSGSSPRSPTRRESGLRFR
jgi:SAM-dependent methyltransferase